ncbi:hypothetical protein N7447_007863 [Penicillium robsamsonii]|uniref:uncharacterized protein n=1 Tax=Penicillium robsamsonii TaxID=1792511 RepID=UPI002548911A|nr:uncharacterized protein N7447_007863 [Penicillium robsamsonii]KAJ5817855.1 hypothetical protein N7447_007863 [Penicillium robsamsonii]
MAYETQLTTVTSENSPTNGKKTQISDGFISSSGPSKHKAPLPSFPNSQSTPYGKTHAGEVRRRTDRQTTPLPAPGTGQSSGGNSTNGFPRRQRRLNGSGNGGYNSGSDSDDDRKPHKRYDDGDDDIGITSRQKRPAHPSPHYVEASSSSPPAGYEEEEEERIHRSMQQILALVEKEMTYYASRQTQQTQIAELVRSMPPGTRPGAIRSETYDSMLEYLELFREIAIESNTTALMRQQTNLPSVTEKASHWIRREFSDMVRDNKVIFKFVQLSKDPPYLVDLPGFDGRFKSYLPTVLRVLVKQNTPRFAEIVSWQFLRDLGWWFCFDTGTWCHNHVEQQNKFSGPIICHMEITGNITKIWEVTDADEDTGYQRYIGKIGKTKGTVKVP